MVAGFTPAQQAAFGTVNNAQGMAQPYIDQAAGYGAQGAAPVGNLTAGNIQQYFDPYQSGVVQATMANINETNAQQQQQVQGNAALRGALGGDRVGVAQAELARQQGLASNQTLAGLQNQGWQYATNTALSQQQNQQANAGRAGQAAYTFGSLGNEALGTTLQGANAQLGAGGLQQQEEQAKLNVPYQQFVQAQAYPFQTQQWLAGIETGVGSNAGGQSSTQGPTPNEWNQVAGLGIAAAGAFANRGGRVGYDIGGGVPEYGSAVPTMGGGIGGMPYAGVQGYVPGGMQLAHGAGPPKPQQGADPNSGAGKMMQDAVGAAHGFRNLLNSNKGQPTQLAPDGSSYQPIALGATNPAITPDMSGDLGPLYRRGGVVGFADGGAPDYIDATDLPPINIGAGGFGLRHPPAPIPGYPQTDNDSAPFVSNGGYNFLDAQADNPPLGGPVDNPTGAPIAPRRGLGLSAMRYADDSAPSAPPAPEAPAPQGEPQQRRFGLGMLPPELRMPLMSAGFSMMSNRMGGPGSFLSAAGQAGEAGLGAYQQQQKYGLEQQKVQVDADYKKAMARHLADQAKLIAAQVGHLGMQTETGEEALSQARDYKDGLGSPAKGAPGLPPAPSAPAAPAAPAGPRVAAGPQQGAPGARAMEPAYTADEAGRPLIDMAETKRRADYLSRFSMIPGAIARANQLYSMIESMSKAGVQPMVGPDGKSYVAPIPGAIDSAAEKEGAVQTEKSAAESRFQLEPTQPVPGGPTVATRKSDILGITKPAPGADGTQPGGVVTKQPPFIAKKQEEIAKAEGDMTANYQKRQIIRERLGEIGDILQKYQTGRWAEAKADAVSMARAIGAPIQNRDTANPEAFERFIKNATGNVFDQIKTMGGRVLVAEILGLTKANANPELQPEANRALVGQALGLLDWQDKHDDDYFAWKGENPNAYDTSQFELPWSKRNPIKGFTKAAQQSTPAKGEMIPPAAQREHNKVYLNRNNDPMRWNGTNGNWDAVQ